MEPLQTGLSRILDFTFGCWFAFTAVHGQAAVDRAAAAWTLEEFEFHLRALVCGRSNRIQGRLLLTEPLYTGLADVE